MRKKVTAEVNERDVRGKIQTELRESYNKNERGRKRSEREDRGKIVQRGEREK